MVAVKIALYAMVVVVVIYMAAPCVAILAARRRARVQDQEFWSVVAALEDQL